MGADATTEPVTLDTVRAGRLRENGHADAKDWFATLYQHTTIPRLQSMDRHPRRRGGGASERVWQVDGLICASLDEAIKRLGAPPVLTDGEREVAGYLPSEWTELHAFRTEIGERLGRQVGADILMLRQKGIVENELRPGERRSVPWIRRAPGVAAAIPSSAPNLGPPPMTDQGGDDAS